LKKVESWESSGHEHGRSPATGAALTDRLDRLAQNEAGFRLINERTAPQADDDEPGLRSYLCECSNLACRERVYLRSGEYESVRADARWFLVAQGHVDPTVERVISHTLRFDIVQKNEAVREIVERTDPRRD
jgi:hypothetical protein